MSRVVISGYFNPIHPGHLDLIDSAAALGEVIVIINNDEQVRLKGSCPFMDETARARIVQSIKNVSKVEIAIDKDETVALTLNKIKPDIFLNAGDREKPNEREAEVCKKIGCRMLYDVTKRKEYSSSILLLKAFRWNNYHNN